MSDAADLATATLPSAASRRSFTMGRHDGTDQVACLLGREGWEAVERPLPTYLFREALRSPGLILDVGANTGFYTLLAASASASNHVVAFEPMPDILELLHRNVGANALREQVRLIRCAIGDRNGDADLFIPLQDHGLIETSASLMPDFKSDHSGSLRVLLRTLDRVVFRPSLIRRRVSLIKIDVEGHEAAVLAGARWTIARHRPLIFIEVTSKTDVDALNGFARSKRYVDVRLDADGPLTVRDDIAFDHGAWNHALVPRERLGEFLAENP